MTPQLATGADGVGKGVDDAIVVEDITEIEEKADDIDRAVLDAATETDDGEACEDDEIDVKDDAFEDGIAWQSPKPGWQPSPQ